jgi:hypothetical protein
MGMELTESPAFEFCKNVSLRNLNGHENMGNASQIKKVNKGEQERRKYVAVQMPPFVV